MTVLGDQSERRASLEASRPEQDTSNLVVFQPGCFNLRD
jgi:hypothetical protein